MAIEHYNNPLTVGDSSVPSGTLSASITNVSTAMSCDGLNSMLANFRVSIENEIVLVTANIAGVQFITRALEGTTAVAHAAGASVYPVVTAASLTNNPLAMTTSGDMPYLDSSLNQARFAIGAASAILGTNGTVPAWEAATGTGAPVRKVAPVLTGPVAIGTTPYNYLGTDVGLTVLGTGTYGVLALQAQQPLIKFVGFYNSGNGAEIYQNSSGTFVFNVNSGVVGYTFDSSSNMRTYGKLGIGVAATANIESLATTEQLRLSYDASHYVSHTVSSVGSLTVAPTGTNPSITLTPAGSGVVNVNSLLGKYNSISTTGWGVPAIYGSGRSVAATAAVASVAAYTVGAADGSFDVNANVLVTTATTHSFTVTVTYTDEGNTSRTLTMNFSTLAGVISNAAITNIGGTVPYEGIPIRVRAKTATAITVATVGTFTAVQYNVEATITQVS